MLFPETIYGGTPFVGNLVLPNDQGRRVEVEASPVGSTLTNLFIDCSCRRHASSAPQAPSVDSLEDWQVRGKEAGVRLRQRVRIDKRFRSEPEVRCFVPWGFTYITAGMNDCTGGVNATSMGAEWWAPIR